MLSSGPSRSRTTFFTLSKELRDQCYELVLTTPLPIVVWSAIRPGNEAKRETTVYFREEMQQAREHNAETIDIRASFLNLIRCNSTIAYEAASVFYGRNRFFFCADWTWTILLKWWKDIGTTNREFVSKIELRIRRPAQALEGPDGERSTHIDNVDPSLEPAYPRSPYLLASPNSSPGEVVESIDPSIETFFGMLHSRSHTSKTLSIHMSLHKHFMPGFRLAFDEYWPFTTYFSMDLPNIMEMLREKGPIVDVSWNGFVLRDAFIAQKPGIEKVWNILCAVDEDVPLPNIPWRPARGNRPERPAQPQAPLKYTRFAVKRKEIKGLPYAAPPKKLWYLDPEEWTRCSTAS